MSLFFQGVIYGLIFGTMIRLFIILNEEINDYFFEESKKFIEKVKGFLLKNIFQYDMENHD